MTASCGSFPGSNKGAMIKDQPRHPKQPLHRGATAMFRILFIFVTWFVLASVDAAEYPAPAQGDFVVPNFRFASDEKLPELRLHYRTLGTPQRDAQGVVRNAVLILHGTGGSGAQFIRPEFAGALFGAGQPLDASRYFIILPDGIGHGQSSKDRKSTRL